MQEASPASFARMVKLHDTCGDQMTELCTAAIATIDQAISVAARDHRQAGKGC
jgi:hypothetical protein